MTPMNKNYWKGCGVKNQRRFNYVILDYYALLDKEGTAWQTLMYGSLESLSLYTRKYCPVNLGLTAFGHR